MHRKKNTKICETLTVRAWLFYPSTLFFQVKFTQAETKLKLRVLLGALGRKKNSIKQR